MMADSAGTAGDQDRTGHREPPSGALSGLAGAGKAAKPRHLRGPFIADTRLVVGLGQFIEIVDVDRRQRAEIGIHPGCVRLSVGIEDPEDLIADFDADALAERQKISFAEADVPLP